MNNLLAPQNKKARTFRCIFYGDLNTFHVICLAHCSEFVFILHDKDMDENGELKKQHIHSILRFPSPIYPKTVKNYFGELLAAPALYADSELVRYLDYFIHKDEPENKHKYDPKEVIYSNKEYWEREYRNHCRDPTQGNIAYQIICDIISKRPFRDMVCAYGREFVVNYEKYARMATRIQESERLSYGLEEAEDNIDDIF